MSPTAGYQGEGWWRGAAPKGRGPARRGPRALLRAFQRWVAQQRYRPERRYMRG
jgi:hypothetical protein